MRLRIILLLLSLVGSNSLSADTWPGWRGKAGRGVSEEKDLPEEWSEAENLLWKADLPGRANSSPAVTKDRIYVTAQTEDDSLRVVALGKEDGQPIYDVKVGTGKLAAPGARNLYAHRHNAATCSPAADEEHLWALFGSGFLVCLDRSGAVKWTRDLVADYRPYNVRFGMASSPRLWGDLLHVACMHKGPSYILALDKKTGRVAWKTDRALKAREDGADAYSSPVILEEAGRASLVVAGCDHVCGYDPLSGKELWISAGLTIDSPFGRVIASPAVSTDVVVACSGHPPGSLGHAIAFKTGGKGEITSTHRLWKYERFSPDAPTPVIYGGRVYMVRDDSIGTTLHVQSGKVLWHKRLARGTYRASVVAGDGKVYYLNIEGVCTVVKAGDEGKVLAENKLPGTFYATPAISDGVLYLRSFNCLYAIGKKK